MTYDFQKAFRFAPALALFVCTFSLALHAQQFAAPVPAELSMTSIPEVPGAPAVILDREQTADDQLHMWSYYSRIKVLSEGGKEYANVELPYFASNDLEGSIDSIVGRTIHADGTIIPFAGKPYDKLLVKGPDLNYKAKVFTLPQVEVGSIIEYRYKYRFSDSYYISPEWVLQSDLFMRRAHYMWRPTTYFTSGDLSVPEHVAWTPVLPPGLVVKESSEQGSSLGANNGAAQVTLQLDVKDIPPLVKEPFMPPVDSLTYRVQFYYTSAKTALEFWNKAGKTWSRDRDKFIGPNHALRAAADAAVSPSDSPEQKVKKLYDLVMTMENTDYTRTRSSQEDKAEGLRNLNNANDVLTRKRGSSDQLAELFVALVRAENLKAYLAAVTDRKLRLFVPFYLTLNQLDDYIAIVPLNGKDVFLDPGERYCTFGHLAWRHALAGGLRQTDDGTAVIVTSAEPYTASSTKRIADLTLDEHGEATGTVSVTYTGDAALTWRHAALRGDDTSLNNELKQRLERELPGGMEVRVTSAEGLTDGDKPVVIKYDVKGAVGSATGKRLLVPVSLFEAGSKPQFTAAKREVAVDMQYPEMIQDAVRIKYPAGLSVESSPAATTEKLKNEAVYSFGSKAAPNSITLFRNVTIGKTYFLPSEYPDLRAFYGKLDNAQGETVVLTRSPAPAATGGN